MLNKKVRNLLNEKIKMTIFDIWILITLVSDFEKVKWVHFKKSETLIL